jgi:hypothetical protein
LSKGVDKLLVLGLTGNHDFRGFVHDALKACCDEVVEGVNLKMSDSLGVEKALDEVVGVEVHHLKSLTAQTMSRNSR